MDVLEVLYDWYKSSFEQRLAATKALRKSVADASNVFLPELISKAEFADMLKRSPQAPGLKQSWINMILAGRESELDALPANVQRFLRDSERIAPDFLTKESESIRQAS